MFGLPRARPTIRRIGSEAAAACAALHRQSFAHAWSQGDLEALLAARECVAHGVTTRPLGPLRGFVLSRLAADEAEVLTIAVARNVRGGGFGGRLLATNMAALAGAGVRTLFLEVEAGNEPARRLYASFGFAEVGRRPAYYRTAEDGRATALVLRRALE